MTAHRLIRPSGSESRTPLIVEVPHAGLTIPEALAEEYVAPREAVMRDADIFVDRLYANAPLHGATLLVADVSRYVVDLNRSRDDVDAVAVPDHPAPVSLQPRGVIWRATTDGRPILKRPLGYAAFQERLSRYYLPYHDDLQREIASLHEAHGYVVVLAAHSMPSTGRSMHPDLGAKRADVVPGTLGRSSADARVIDLVDAHFRHAGLSVRHDDPYRGGFTTANYGQPGRGVHVIQIELNRALYVDEATFEVRTPEFEALRSLLDELARALGSLRLA